MLCGSFVVWAWQGIQWLYLGEAETFSARILMCEIFECPSGDLRATWVGAMKIVNFLLNLNAGVFLLIVGGMGLYIIVFIFHKLANLGVNFEFVIWLDSGWGRSR